MKIMAIDLGDVRTGLAVSDPTGTLVGEAWTVTERNRARLTGAILQAAAERGVEALVLGHPKNMDGTRGPRAEKTEAFKAELEAQTSLPITLWDERRTSAQADDILREVGKRGRRKKQLQDAVAASLILEGYLAFSKM